MSDFHTAEHLRPKTHLARIKLASNGFLAVEVSQNSPNLSPSDRPEAGG
ncbi:hypothetical protein GA0061102_103022 [Rhizobium miluonense]|uniref:Uncharacterized protein n=1 Tax=Rhizobium miluonense TaxID=411945 RepID=A0A1C3WHA2_9HYPH|nr:hypothetical protein GA0061102_103022 [Rhizobium miluonense]